MKSQLSVVAALLGLAVLALSLSSRLADSQPAQTAVIDPGVLEALQTQSEVRVFIALKNSPIPVIEQTTAYRQQSTAATQARVLSSLGPDDFVLIYQFPLSPALSVWITEKGLEKLASHPDVVAVELPVVGGWNGSLEEATPVIDPAVLEALQNQEQVEVLVVLKDPPVPMSEWTTAVRQQNTAQRQDRVLSVLGASDFTLTHRFETVSALDGVITTSGVQKLADHPDVLGIGVNSQVFGGQGEAADP